MRPQRAALAILLKKAIVGIQNLPEQHLEQLLLHPAEIKPLLAAAHEADFQGLAQVLQGKRRG